MKKYQIILVLFTAAFFTLSSCRKEGLQTIELVGLVDSGKTVSIMKGQSISITVSNPGDGGFTYDAWQYDSSILHLASHTSMPPTRAEAEGDFGSDNWKFTAVKSGSTALALTASRGGTDAVILFNSTISVQ